MKRRLALPQVARVALLATVGAGALVRAGQSGVQTPTFRSGVEYVEVDAIVTNGAGQFVRDLKREDFQLLEDGKPQAISDFTLVDVPIERFDKPLYAAAPIDPDVRSNEKPFDGRVYVMVIDDRQIDFNQTERAKQAARLFIQQRLGANDLMSVLHTGRAEGASQEFTSSKRLLFAAVDETIGQKLPAATRTRAAQTRRSFGTFSDDPQDAERAQNAESSLNLLTNVSDWFATVRGRRKAILFISEGVDYDITQVTGGGRDAAQYASVVLDSTRAAIESAMRSNVSIFGIDPRGLNLADTDVQDGVGGLGSGLQTEDRNASDSLRTLSDQTGGFAVVGRNNLAAAYDRIVADNSSYYVLAYYPPADRRDGKLHKIDVRVSRPGLTARARSGYLSPKGKAPAPPAPNDKGPSPELRDALNSPLPVTGLTMNVTLAPFKGKAPNASVFVATEVRGKDLALTPDSTLEFSYLAVDASGKIRGGNNDRIKWTVTPETRTRIEAGGFRLLNRFEIPPGRYQVRIATHDPSGPVGSVIYDLDVPNFYKAPFSISGVVLASLSNGSMVTLKPDEDLKNVLPAPPVALRTFAQNDEVALFVEIYDNSEDANHKVDILTTLTADDGKVLFKTEEERSASELGGSRGGFGYSARVPLADIPPGSYVLNVDARSRLGKSPGASRQVPIKVVAPAQ